MVLNCKDVLEDIQSYEDHFFNTIFCDPPYNLGSRIIVGKNGKLILKKSKDFMNRWCFEPHQWESFFKEAYRTLKWGGYCVLFAIERQAALIQYYAVNAGFEICQGLYWYQMQGFPKGVNVSKQLGKKDIAKKDMIKKYNGYMMGIAPLKPCVENILIFRAPFKSSCQEDILETESNDKKISPGVVNISNVRIPADKDTRRKVGGWYSSYVNGIKCKNWNDYLYRKNEGRYPAQLFIDSSCSDLLNIQSGELKSGKDRHPTRKSVCGYFGSKMEYYSSDSNYGDSGGCSRILHHCDYDELEVNGGDLIFYCPKVSRAEREAGLKNFEKQKGHKTTNAGLSNIIKRCPVHHSPIPSGYSHYQCGCSFVYSGNGIVKPVSNPHPTLKPIKLTTLIALLFKLPVDDQKVYVPFAGSGSEIIGLIKAGINKDHIYACEVEAEYVEIARARIKFWNHHDYQGKKIIKKEVPYG